MPLANKAPKAEFTAGSYLYGFTAGDNRDSRFSAFEIINAIFSGQLLGVNSYKFADGNNQEVNASTNGYFTIIKHNDIVTEIRINILNLNEENNSATIIDFLNINSQTTILFKNGSGQNIGYFLVQEVSTILNYISITISETKFISTFQNEEVYTLSLDLVSNQDNVLKEINLGVSNTPSDLQNPKEAAIALINSLASFEITEKQVVFFYLEILGNFFTFGLNNLGKGFYGAGSDPLTTSDIQIIAKSSEEFTQDEQAQLRALIYTAGTATLAVAPTTFERNLIDGVTVTFNWDIVANDDNINTATFDGVDISANLISNQSFANVKNTISKQLAVQFENSSDQSTNNENITRTATARIPQWKGQKVNNTTLNGSSYTALGSAFTKIVQANSATSITVDAGNYGVFVSTNNNATIIENGTGFALAESAYIKNTITVEYQDGTALTLTEYIINTAVQEFSYTIN